ncbi:hypothetical protein, partial [Candidatus Ichthyocystis hellenicum]|uniref:hypothetical protein n=1 Tax=Candidatus Ichthyocystis hellenicum TaxID=1561003 RepID=UPI001584C2DB
MASVKGCFVSVIFSDGFKNTKELFKKEEIRYCNDVADRSSYLTGSGPYGESTAGFKNLLESGERLKFVISGKGMFIGKINISHASIASFQQVMTAGHVRCTGSIKFDRETCGFRRV